VKAQARWDACNLIHSAYPLGSNQHHVAFEISARGDYFELLSNGKAFARLDKAFCSEARRLVGLEVRFQACLERKRWEEVTRPSRSYTDGIVTFSVDVNVKGLMNHADKVGNILLSSGIFLQYPTHNPAGETYYNPQILQIEGFHEKSDDMMIEADDASTPGVIPDRPSQSVSKPSLNPQDHVEQILDSLSHTNILQEIRTDTSRIKSTLMRQVCSSSGWEIQTDPYHRHQKMALDFIAQRESGRPFAELTFWRERRRNGET
jgi:SWI/SNF-related matrix-associated actin-dependent regulator of chromatin subfamily A3